MNVFNSLGSNYNFSFVTTSLFRGDNSNQSAMLNTYLENKYKGKAILLYKGREAIEMALSLLKLPSGSSVAINGFTCFAVYQAIINAGYEVKYLDIHNLDLNFSAQEFKKSLRKNPAIKVLIIQNTLGYPCNIEDISKICRQHKIILIEDLAHSVGTKYQNGKEAGMAGDFVILSFSQDKIIDAVSGGALIIRNKKYLDYDLPKFKKIDVKQEIINRFYPLFTYIIRNTYQINLGKLIHGLLRKCGLLSNPMNNLKLSTPHSLPVWYQTLALLQFQDLEKNISRRQTIAKIYENKLNPQILSLAVTKQISQSTNLRFPIFVENRSDLINYLKKYGIYVSDIWYDAPIAPQKYMHLTNYTNQCPKAEKISDQILNLPTHQNISEKQAEEISERINQWLKL